MASVYNIVYKRRLAVLPVSQWLAVLPVSQWLASITSTQNECTARACFASELFIAFVSRFDKLCVRRFTGMVYTRDVHPFSVVHTRYVHPFSVVYTRDVQPFNVVYT